MSDTDGIRAKDPEARRTLIANERAKLTATYANGLAVAVAAVGGLAPIFSILYASGPAIIPIWIVLGNSLGCWIASAALHQAARRHLRELME